MSIGGLDGPRLRAIIDALPRAIAVTESEALATGLSLEEIREKSFVKIMAARRTKA